MTTKRRPIRNQEEIDALLVFAERLPMIHRGSWQGRRIDRGSIVYAWFHWRRGYQGRATVERI